MNERNADYLKKLNIQKVEDYLYTIYYDDYDYSIGIERAKIAFGYTGGCAAIRNGNFRGRNYDWTYDDEAYFIIKTPARNGRHAVLGVAGSIKVLTMDFVDSKEWNDAYYGLPFATLDGINDAGLICNILVVPSGEMGLTSGSNPGCEIMPASMINRYVLDYASTVDEALELLRNRNIYMPHCDYLDQEFHWMISDYNRTVVIEFINNKMHVLEDEKIATNFYLYGFDKTETSLPRIPEGIERYDLIADNYDMTSTKDGMMKMLQSLNYSQCYDLSMVPFWYSEYSGGNLDVNLFGDKDLSDGDLTKAGAYRDAIAEYLDAWKKGRNNNTWITVYSAVYDMKNLSLSLVTQENDILHEYFLDQTRKF